MQTRGEASSTWLWTMCNTYWGPQCPATSPFCLRALCSRETWRKPRNSSQILWRKPWRKTKGRRRTHQLQMWTYPIPWSHDLPTSPCQTLKPASQMAPLINCLPVSQSACLRQWLRKCPPRKIWFKSWAVMRWNWKSPSMPWRSPHQVMAWCWRWSCPPCPLCPNVSWTSLRYPLQNWW